MNDLEQRIRAVIAAEHDDIKGLLSIAGLDATEDMAFLSLGSVDLSEQDLVLLNFEHCDLNEANLRGPSGPRQPTTA